jgi:hypothetical protein
MSGGLGLEPRRFCCIDDQMAPGPCPAPLHHEIMFTAAGLGVRIAAVKPLVQASSDVVAVWVMTGTHFDRLLSR